MHVLDINVVIALRAQDTFVMSAMTLFLGNNPVGRKTCFIRENGCVCMTRYLDYPDVPGSSETVRNALLKIYYQNAGRFWPDYVFVCSFVGLPASKHLKDNYRLAACGLTQRVHAHPGPLSRRRDRAPRRPSYHVT